MDAADSDTDIMTSAYIYYGMRIHMAELRRFQKWLCVQCCPEKAWFSPDAVLAVSFCIRIYL